MDFLRGGRGGRVPAPGGGEIGRRGPQIVVRRAPEREREAETENEDGEESAE
jgi:hypothetical protein